MKYMQVIPRKQQEQLFIDEVDDNDKIMVYDSDGHFVGMITWDDSLEVYKVLYTVTSYLTTYGDSDLHDLIVELIDSGYSVKTLRNKKEK